VVEKVDNTNANNSNRTQAINNYLCENSSAYRGNYDQLVQAVASNQGNVNINGTLLNTSNIPIKYCSQVPLSNLNVSRVKGGVVYDPEIGKRAEPEATDEIAWGDYRISMKEHQFNNIKSDTSSSPK
jgi:hypothetical protein